MTYALSRDLTGTTALPDRVARASGTRYLMMQQVHRAFPRSWRPTNRPMLAWMQVAEVIEQLSLKAAL